MRENGVPQFTVDGHRAVRDFDLLGVSFATELGYTNLLEALDLAGIPLHAVDRDETPPGRRRRRARRVQPRAGQPTSSTAPSSATASRSSATSPTSSRRGRRRARPGGRVELLARLARVDGVYVPRFYAVSYGPDGAIAAVTRTRDDVPARVGKRTVMDLDEWPYPKTPLVPLAESRARADERRDLPRLHPRLPLLPGRDDHPPGARADDHRHRLDGRAGPQGDRLRGGRAAVACPAPTTPRSASWPRSSPTATRAPTPASACRSTRVDAFNVTLANELSRNGRRSGLTFAPEGGSERIRRVINKTVSKEDLVRTVTTAYANGWRQVKLYFMCGLPTETDEDVLEIADLAVEVIRAGREASGQKDIRCTVLDRRLRAQAAHAVPVGRPGQRRDHRPPAAAAAPEDQRGPPDRPLDRPALPRRQARRDRRTALPRRPPRRPGHRAGLARRRQVRRLERALLLRPLDDGGRRGAGARSASTSTGSPPASAPSTRSCPGTTWTPGWTRSGSGRTGRRRCHEEEVADCRWTPCYDCGVCPTMGTEIQIGPTGRSLLPLTVV